MAILFPEVSGAHGHSNGAEASFLTRSRPLSCPGVCLLEWHFTMEWLRQQCSGEPGACWTPEMQPTKCGSSCYWGAAGPESRPTPEINNVNKENWNADNKHAGVARQGNRCDWCHHQGLSLWRMVCVNKDRFNILRFKQHLKNRTPGDFNCL